ncbi:hypothetical protein GDO86_011572 [Hymenochirus boettgeri]|uniref:CUB domain-containing protein 1 n=1 Tax=Hymenochirus boettgeri TaxID=247094 RepID=A0A8T2JHL4_9PIPI|nr:hypothetical protein GDO86_011572 [Hymenochirus boettgeri]
MGFRDRMGAIRVRLGLGTADCVLLLGIGWLLLHLADSLTVSLKSGDNITIWIKPGNVIGPTCYICSPMNNCKLTTLEIRSGMNVEYRFSCLNPEKYYVMEIQKKIDCNTGLCPFGNVQLKPSGLDGLNRTFFWHVEAARNIGIELNFSSPWLNQINPFSKCPDLVTYKISTVVVGSSINIGTFCRIGSVSRVKVQGGGVVALELPWNETLAESGFSIANRSSIKRLCIIESTFQTESVAELMSANYAMGFPNDDLMTWNFIIPIKYSASIEFLNYSIPSCERKEHRVEYYLPNYRHNPEVLVLSDKQPSNIAGNFNLSLQNCDLDSVSEKALNLHFRVTVQQTPSQGSTVYYIDLKEEKDMTVYIRRRPVRSRHFVPICKICKEQTDCYEELNMTGGNFYRISFLCPDFNILMTTAEKTMACWDLKTCNISNEPLSIPPILISLPVPLEKITWHLQTPSNISTEIVSTYMKLQQLTFNNSCDSAGSDFLYNIVSTDGKANFKIGTFCPVGPIEKVQLRDNVTITLDTQANTNVSSLLKHDLRVSFVSRIEEECIFTVSPAPYSTVNLQTPNWEEGLPDSVSVSWNIPVPPKQYGQIKFAKSRMDIMCEIGHAFIYIKEQNSSGKDNVWKEYDNLPSSTNVSSTFWLNISNCRTKTQSKKLQMAFSVTYGQSQPDQNILIITCLAVIAIVILIIVTAVCCIRKKKKEKESPLGIYNTKVNTEMPKRQNLLRKGKKTKESHIYAVIDDTMVYGHLLKEDAGLAIPDADVDVYRPFEGPVADAPPVPPLSFINGKTKEETIEDPLANSMKENELYSLSTPIINQPVENEDTSITYWEERENGPVSSA